MLKRTHLTIIRAVDQQGSLTTVAQHLYLTQAGEYLLGIANRVMPQMDNAESMPRQMVQDERSTLRIGMWPAVHGDY